MQHKRLRDDRSPAGRPPAPTCYSYQSVSALSIATATEVFDLLRDDLAAVEQEFARQSDSPVEAVTDIANYLIAGGGKRIRPLLLLLAAKACGSRSDARIRLGAVVEMLHTATLVHDDIIDEA